MKCGLMWLEGMAEMGWWVLADVLQPLAATPIHVVRGCVLAPNRKLQRPRATSYRGILRQNSRYLRVALDYRATSPSIGHPLATKGACARRSRRPALWLTTSVPSWISTSCRPHSRPSGLRKRTRRGMSPQAMKVDRPPSSSAVNPGIRHWRGQLVIAGAAMSLDQRVAKED